MSDLDAVLAQTPVGRIEDVLDRLTRIDAALPPADGVRYFNGLYVLVTTALLQAEESGVFKAPAFLETLDVAFGNLYFAALLSWTAGKTPPRAWAPLFDAHERVDVQPLQFAFAGMNAHINRDLPVALVASFESAGIVLRREGPEHDDYERVNEILADVETKAKTEYFDPLVARLDRKFDGVDDVVAAWGIKEAREASWVNAEALWELRANTRLSADYLSALDGTVGFAGRGLLVATAI